jgi:glycerophosphoryl diester phosphodiesterase
MRHLLPGLPAVLAISMALATVAGHAEHQQYMHNKNGVANRVQLGPRPFYLVEDMDEGELKTALQQCSRGPFYKTGFSIGHRGAALQFPEHTKESYQAAARMGAGIIECDVTFTSDRQLVCRHSQCDLHTTTDILARPELAAKCRQPFTPADPLTGKPAAAMCCTSDITLAEFKTLCGKMDSFDPSATSVEQYLKGTADWRTTLYATCGTVLSHKESIELFKTLGAKMTPELKAPGVAMPFQGDYTQQQFAQQMIDEYIAAGVEPEKVFAQSFDLRDIKYWLERVPRFGNQAVYLDPRVEFPAGYADAVANMDALAAQGVKIVAPQMSALLTLDAGHNIVPSDYAVAAKRAGLKIIAWTLERSGPLNTGGDSYYATVADVINNDGDMMNVLHVLAHDVGVIGVFSDWPATVTYYANCMGLR